MVKIRITAILLIALAVFGGYFIYKTETKGDATPAGGFGSYPFKLGLDLNGGTHLVYQADTSKVEPSEVRGAMVALRDTIENRINVFGVSEPLVQVEESNVGGQRVDKLIVELPGVTDTQKAIDIIGKTPILEFRLMKDFASTTDISQIPESELFDHTGLTGRLLERADLEFNPNTNEPMITLSFNDEGKKLFAELTKANVGKILAIFLDGRPLSAPVIRDSITDGKAQITGKFNPAEAKKLVQDLNYGALPLPVALIGTQTIGASLGEGALDATKYAGILSFILITVFLVFWYRLPGLVASIALVVYAIINLIIFKLVPVTLTTAGLAGFILSIGMAVDANILIFERMKEELKRGLNLEDAIREGFHRAWLSIRDSNMSSIITAFILYYFATSALIKGFAFVFAIGVVASMFTAITVSRTLLIAIGIKKTNRLTKFLFGNGLINK
jgi:preprotein translocase subunit SecD